MKFSNFTQNYLKIINELEIIPPNINFKKYPINFNYKTKYKIIKKYKNLIKSRFIPENIYSQINDIPYFTTIQIDNLIINLFGTQNNTFFRKQIKFIKIISSINNYFSLISNNKNKIIISIYFTPFKKNLDFNSIIKPININSGFTYTNFNDYKNIIIFRQQEWKKVLIHELIHAYNIDNYKNITAPFIYGKDMIYESLTEFIAIIIHSQMISQLTKISFDEIILNEIKFNILQSRKILYFWNIKKFVDFHNIKITTESSPFSYFIFKTELLLNYNKYKNLLNNFQLPKIHLESFYDIFKFNINYSHFKDDNLRMTLYDLQ